MAVTQRSAIVVECSRCSPKLIGYFYTDTTNERVTQETVDQIVTQHRDEHVAIDARVARVLRQAEEDNAQLTMKTGIKLEPIPECPGDGCTAKIGEEHNNSCDVARCLVTGTQRKLIDHIRHLDPEERENHKCGQDVWTGYWPGDYEAAKYGTTRNAVMKFGRWDVDQLQWVMDERNDQ